MNIDWDEENYDSFSKWLVYHDDIKGIEELIEKSYNIGKQVAEEENNYVLNQIRDKL